MPSCLQLLLAQVHHAMGTILASPSLDIQGARGRCPEGCSTDLGSITQPGQPLQGRGTGDLLVPGDLGWEQHSTALQTRPRCRVQSCKSLFPPRSQPAEAGALRCSPLAMQLPPQPYRSSPQGCSGAGTICPCDDAAMLLPRLSSTSHHSRSCKKGTKERGPPVYIFRVQWGEGGF